MVTSGITSYTHLPVFVLASPEGTDIIGSLFICVSANPQAVSRSVKQPRLESSMKPDAKFFTGAARGCGFLHYRRSQMA